MRDRTLLDAAQHEIGCYVDLGGERERAELDACDDAIASLVEVEITTDPLDAPGDVLDDEIIAAWRPGCP